MRKTGQAFNAALMGAALLLVACGDRREQFLAGRVLDRCDTTWPVCDRIAGCLVGDQSYLEGRFPGSSRVAVQIFEPSTVRAAFLLEETTAAGTETAIGFYEDRCRARIREVISGRAFVGEAESQGFVVREAELFGVGDHLIEFESDARTKYLLKLEVVPIRLQEK